MFNLGPFELVAIFVVALLVFGPDKLPEMGRQVGKAVREFRKFQASMQSNVRDVLDPITGPIIPNGPAGPPPTNVRDGGVASGATANVPRSATIQNPEPGEGDEGATSGTYGYYATPGEPASPPNGPAAAPGDAASAAPSAPAAQAPPAEPAPGGPPPSGPAETTPPERPAESDPR